MILNRNQAAKRAAILIGNAKSGGKFLPGVELDINAMRQYLLSPSGGAWSESEIAVITDQQKIKKDALLMYLNDLRNTGTDYVYIYFAGHGELSRTGNPMFILPGGEGIELDEIKKMIYPLPVLMISDSCQGIPSYGEGGALNENQRLFSEGNPVEQFKARREFDNAIKTLPQMFTYASAVSPGQYANEDSNMGGLYTQNLLKACKGIVELASEKKTVVGICRPHQIAALDVASMTNFKQRPTISGYNRTHQPPFVVKL